MSAQQFLDNARVVPLYELFTLESLVIVTVAFAIAQYLKFGPMATLLTVVLIGALTIAWNATFKHPDNLGYYLGVGEKPPGWQGF